MFWLESLIVGLKDCYNGFQNKFKMLTSLQSQLSNIWKTNSSAFDLKVWISLKNKTKISSSRLISHFLFLITLPFSYLLLRLLRCVCFEFTEIKLKIIFFEIIYSLFHETLFPSFSPLAYDNAKRSMRSFSKQCLSFEFKGNLTAIIDLHL